MSMGKKIFNSDKLLNLEKDELFIYILLKTIKYFKINPIPYSMIRSIMNKKITFKRIEYLIKQLIKKQIIKKDKYNLIKR